MEHQSHAENNVYQKLNTYNERNEIKKKAA